ncbi:MAG: hypothetical protein AUH37_01575 [Candidatus Nitrososphaera sp. 13_1_40CM_48_12]|nr:MAG: hypothetical protein AUH71_04165 [Thaumarchaeota archaeon 13_1_40CM_4_48_7]OLC26027.1 MAG: hypothetical protein AUH37_01575 [Candidatus Nitrososphaera sp. 13_1_40CM_48_12]
MLIYLGVGMFLFGLFLVLVTSTSSFNLNMFTVLGILVTTMGLIVSILGARMNSAENSSIQSDEQR